jgi:hypothetical protein
MDVEGDGHWVFQDIITTAWTGLGKTRNLLRYPVSQVTALIFMVEDEDSVFFRNVGI